MPTPSQRRPDRADDSLRRTDAPCVRVIPALPSPPDRDAEGAKGTRLEIDGKPPIPAKSYAFDLILEAGEPVDRLQAAMWPMLEATFSGTRTGTETKIASVLMYGTSGAGKTYTLAEVLPGLVASIDHLITVTPGTSAATAYISATEYTLVGQKVLIYSPLPGGALGQADGVGVGVGAQAQRTLRHAMQVVAKAKQTRETANNATSSRSVVWWVVGVRWAESDAHGMLVLLDLPGKENSQDATSKWINDVYEVLGKAMQRKLYATPALSKKLAQTIQWEAGMRGGGGGGLLSVGTVGSRVSRAGSVSPSVSSVSGKSSTKGSRGWEREAQAREERTMISRLCKPPLRGIATFLAGLGPAPLTMFSTSTATATATDTNTSAPTGCIAICCLHPTPADRLKCRSTLDFALGFTLLYPPIPLPLSLPLCASAGALERLALGARLSPPTCALDSHIRLLGMLAAVTLFFFDPEEMLELCAAAARATEQAIPAAAAAAAEAEEGEEGVREMLRQITVLAEETTLPPRVKGALETLLALLDQVDADDEADVEYE